MTQELCETRQSKIPQTLVCAEPAVGLLEWTRIQPAVVNSPAHSARDQSGTLERLDVFRRGRERHVIRLGEFTHGMLTRRKSVEHGAASGVAERVEDEVEIPRLFNHMVEYS